MKALEGKVIVLGVCGGIAAYKIPSLVNMLVRAGATVHVIMTENACQIIQPIVFDELSGNKCLVDTFDRAHEFKVEHIALAKRADLIMVAPATANTLAKLAHGLADNMLTTTFLAATCPRLIVPSMNTHMYENPVTQDNLALCQKYGMRLVEPAAGLLACGDVGKGKLPEPAQLFAHIELALACPKDLTGLCVLVTAGGTREALDPVRFITNRSSGKMGYALAKVAACRGARVCLVSTVPESQMPAPIGVEYVGVESAADMFEAVSSRAADMDIIIKAAAVADFTPAKTASEKLKKEGGMLFRSESGDYLLPLKRTRDILAWLGENRRPGQFICGFSMETEALLENSRRKLVGKRVDMIVANNVKIKGAGFGTDTNLVQLITPDGARELPLMSKEDVADEILTEIASRLSQMQSMAEPGESDGQATARTGETPAAQLTGGPH